MNNRPIGVFDSGLGGLTAVRELCRALPNEDIVYFGDTGRVPYGTRSRGTILKYTSQDIAFLRSQGVKMIIAACGTVSSVAGELTKDLDLPFTGVVQPTALAAAKSTRNGKIGVIGTSATIKSGSFRNELLSLNPSFEILDTDCPLFVPLVENGFIDNENQVTKLVAEGYLNDLRSNGIDTLILGCTHYPMISNIIKKVVGPEVTIINSGRETALAAERTLSELSLLKDTKDQGSYTFYVSDTAEGFSRSASLFLSNAVNFSVKSIDIEQYG